MAKEAIFTREGYEAARNRLEMLQTQRRKEVADRIQHAREFGDISENSEYDDAKNEQAMLEQEIALLEERVRDAQIVDVVTVDVKDEKGVQHTYQLVGSSEADPEARRISVESPVGKALNHRQEGEVVEVQTPRGSRRLEILAVRRG